MIWAGLAARRPGRYAAAHARTGRHGEALAAIEPAVQAYRRLAAGDRGAYLPRLAAALTRQADELGYLDRVTEARAAAAEAEMIRTDMLPSPYYRPASQPPGNSAAGTPTD